MNVVILIFRCRNNKSEKGKDIKQKKKKKGTKEKVGNKYECINVPVSIRADK
jgi:hypothetical protein